MLFRTCCAGRHAVHEWGPADRGSGGRQIKYMGMQIHYMRNDAQRSTHSGSITTHSAMAVQGRPPSEAGACAQAAREAEKQREAAQAAADHEEAMEQERQRLQVEHRHIRPCIWTGRRHMISRWHGLHKQAGPLLSGASKAACTACECVGMGPARPAVQGSLWS